MNWTLTKLNIVRRENWKLDFFDFIIPLENSYSLMVNEVVGFDLISITMIKEELPLCDKN